MVVLLSTWSSDVREAIRDRAEIIAVSPNTNTVYMCTTHDARDPTSAAYRVLRSMGISQFDIKLVGCPHAIMVARAGRFASSKISVYNAQAVCPDAELTKTLPLIL